MSKVEVLRVSNRIFKGIGINNITGFKMYDCGFDVAGYHSFEYDSEENFINCLRKIMGAINDLKIGKKEDFGERNSHTTHNETILG